MAHVGAATSSNARRLRLAAASCAVSPRACVDAVIFRLTQIVPTLPDCLKWRPPLAVPDSLPAPTPRRRRGLRRSRGRRRALRRSGDGRRPRSPRLIRSGRRKKMHRTVCSTSPATLPSNFEVRPSSIEVRGFLLALGGPPRRHGCTQRDKLVPLDPGKGPGTRLEQMLGEGDR